MRRHSLAGRPKRLLGGILLASLVIGVVAAGPRPSATPPLAVAVTITTAPGETQAFEPATTAVHAAGPVVLTFRNGSNLSHNLVFTGALTAATRTIVEPGTSDEVRLVPSGPGAYPFVCTIHDGMRGVLIVERSASGGN